MLALAGATGTLARFFLSRWVQQWPGLVQALFYLATGMIWVTPLKPLLRWMEAGRKRG